MADEHYIVMTVECPRCRTKQKIHVSTDIGGVQALLTCCFTIERDGMAATKERFF